MKNKEIEAYIFDLFRKYSNGMVSNEVIHEDKPDFRFIKDGQWVGVEVTRYFWQNQIGIPYQATEEYMDKLRFTLNASSTMKRLSGGTVSVHLTAEVLNQLNSRKKLADMLLDFVQKQHFEGDSVLDFTYWELPEALSSMGVNSIRIHSIPKLTGIHWSFPTARFIPKLKKSNINEIIKKKEELLSEYRQHVDVVWLLIAFNIQGLASTFDPESPVFSEKYHTLFDQVITLSPPEICILDTGA